MLPILELLERVDRVRHVHFWCNTLPEWKFNLERFDSRANFQILYLAGHGSDNRMHLANDEIIELPLLSERMQYRFAGWTVHLGACETLSGSNEDVRKFMEKTGVEMLTGYSQKNVDWIPSAALELLWFSALQENADFKTIWKKFHDDQLQLVHLNGLNAVFAGK